MITRSQILESPTKDFFFSGSNQHELLKYIVLLSAEIDRLKSFDGLKQNEYEINGKNKHEINLWKERLEVCERKYQSLERNYREVINENTRLESLAQSLTNEIKQNKIKVSSYSELMRNNEEMRKDNEFLAKNCANLKESLRNSEGKKPIFKDNQRIYKDPIELEAYIVLLRAENDRLHGFCEGLSMELNENIHSSRIAQQPPPLDNNLTPELYMQFGTQINLHQEVSLWKGRFYEIERIFNEMNKAFNEKNEKLVAFERENEILKENLKRNEEEIKRMGFEWREAEKLAVLFPEMNEQINRLFQENERLKSVILNRCRDLTQNAWSF